MKIAESIKTAVSHTLVCPASDQDNSLAHRHPVPMTNEDETSEGAYRVLDDLGIEAAITPAELDAVEAFLLPQIIALLRDAKQIKYAHGLESAEKMARIEGRF
ncbi:MAG: hypothetical protein ACTHM2_10340 [Afipia sp.]